MRHPVPPRRAGRRSLAACGTLVAVAAALLGQLLLPSASAPASAVAATGCDYGTGGSQAASTCWLDFTGFSDTTARTSAGQPFSIALPGGYHASFSVHLADVPGFPQQSFTASAVPTWGGAYLGQNGHYENIGGLPVLYSSAPTVGAALITVSNISVQDSAGRPVSGFALLAADAESTNGNSGGRESLTFESDVPLQRVDSQAVCGGGLTGVGTTTVSCIGDDATAQNALFLQAVDPGTVSIRTQEASTVYGLQGVAFAFVHATVQVDVAVAGRVDASDAFQATIAGGGTTLGSASTAGTNAASTGPTVVVPSTSGAPYGLALTATSGSLANYSSAWTCTNGAVTSATALPTGSGMSKTIAMLAGDAVDCTVTLTPLSRGISVAAAAQVTDVDGDGLTDRGDRVTLTYTVDNTGGTSLDGITVTDPSAGTVTCAATTLAPGATTTCTATRTITASDETAGSVTTSAVASGSPPSSPALVASSAAATNTPVVTAAPALTVGLVPASTHYAAPGDVVTWTATVRNTGNVGLTALAVTPQSWAGAGAAPAFACTPVAVATGATAVCTAAYTVTQADIDAGALALDVTAAALRRGGGTGATGTTSSTVVQGYRTAAVSLALAADRPTVQQAGDRIVWTFTAANTGTTTLRGLRAIVTGSSSTATLPAADCADLVLAPGATTTCSATVAVTQADVDSGRITLAGVLQAAASDGSTAVSSTVDAAVRSTPTAVVAMRLATVGDTPTRAGQSLLVRYTATNSGTGTLQGVRIAAARGAGSLRCPDASSTLAPGASIVCEAAILVTDADVTAGAILEHADAAGQLVAAPSTAVQDVAVVRSSLVPVQRVELVLTAPDRAYREGESATVDFVLRNTGTMHVETSGATARFGTRTTAVVCDDATVAPGESTPCHIVGRITAADVAAGTVALRVGMAGAAATSASTTIRTVAATAELAFTGSDAIIPIAGGALAVLIGLVLLLVTRRRRQYGR